MSRTDPIQTADALLAQNSAGNSAGNSTQNPAQTPAADTTAPETRLVDPATVSDPAALLASLRDIHLPEQTGSVLPPGPLLLAGGGLLLLAMLGVYFARKRGTADWRQVAQREISVIRQQMPNASATETLAACSRLLRRVCMALAPRSEVAAMTGEPWLELLDSLHQSSEFSHGPGRALVDEPYRRPDTPGSTNTARDGKQPKATEEVVSLVENFINHAGPLRS